MELDKLYAVSDLHIGGAPKKRAFREERALAWLIGEAKRSPARRVGFLMNGDIFDFLADPTNAHEFAVDAESRIREYARDEHLGQIFEALKNFVATTDRHVILQIGNHDIELALPATQRALCDVIDPNGDAFQQIHFVSDRRGWACRVAGRMVLAVHGNASDPWNAVDHDGLTAAVGAAEAGRVINAPITNAGTILVLEVMNQIKDRYPFVDLFKPEGPALFALLDWFNPPKSRRGLIRATMRLLRRGGLQGARELLGGEDEAVDLPASGPGRELVDYVGSLPAPAPDSDALMARAERHLGEGKTPRDLAETEIGHLRAAWDGRLRTKLPGLAARVDGLKRPPGVVLQQALQGWLARDRSFELDERSDIDRRIIESGRMGFDVLLAGHTHLARELGDGTLTYLNTGTWMRLLNLCDSPYLGDRFGEFLENIEDGSLAALDRMDLDPRLRPVAIVDDTSARLEGVDEAGGYHLRPLRSRRP